jgi:hypothetical protein
MVDSCGYPVSIFSFKHSTHFIFYLIFSYVHSNSFASKLLYRNGKVTGIKYQKNGEEITAGVVNDVIISAGALNTPGMKR